jgi:hypothetical protein
MALDLFRVSGGLQINDSTQILEGSAAPASDAPIGSLYTNTTTGVQQLETYGIIGAGRSTVILDTPPTQSELAQV